MKQSFSALSSPPSALRLNRNNDRHPVRLKPLPGRGIKRVHAFYDFIGELNAQRQEKMGGKNIDNAAADGKFPLGGHLVLTPVAKPHEASGQRIKMDFFAGIKF